MKAQTKFWLGYAAIVIGIFLFIYHEVSAEISVAYSLDTSHVKYGKYKNEYSFNEDNKVISLEYKKGKDIIGITEFNNSFYNQSFGIYYARAIKVSKKMYGIYRLGILKGYHEEDSLLSNYKTERIYFNNPTVFYKDYSLMASVGLGYNFSKHLAIESDLCSNAVVTAIKYTF